MRIGLLTLALRTNYGGNLQAYALMTVLKSLGHEVWLIDYRKKVSTRQRIWRTLLASLRGFGPNGRAPDAKTSLKGKPYSPIHWFTEQHIRPQTEIFFSSAELAEGLQEYALDAIVIGSDQVWRPRYSPNVCDYFFGFLPDSDAQTRRIVYAASFGTTDWTFTPEQTRACATLLRHADAVSVREDSGITLCRDHLGVTWASHVIDPTMLLEPGHYRELASQVGAEPDGAMRERSGVLTYILDTNQEKQALIDRVAGRLLLPTRAAKWAEWRILAGTLTGNTGEQTVEGWLRSFQQAEFVVTDSFHGCIFAILFNKPFIAFGNEARGMARFASLLSMFGLEERLVSSPAGADVEKLLRPMAWDGANRILAERRKDALDFLASALATAPELTERGRMNRGIPCSLTAT